MNSKVKIALLGGDLRHYTAACYLKHKGWDVYLWGNRCENDGQKDTVVFCEHYEDAVADAYATVLPLPTSVDGKTLNCPMAPSEIRPNVTDLLSGMADHAILIGGRLPTNLTEGAEKRGLRFFDYFSSEEFQIKNAYTTAEAALSIAMNSMTKEVRGSHIAVTGYGRIAKQLVTLLRGIGARVTVVARKRTDLTWAELLGCDTLLLGEDRRALQALHQGFDIIYNTIPVWIFDRDFLERVEPKTFLIDLASAPGGIDICAAKELDSNVLWATSLPGKYAPESAGTLIGACVNQILQEEVRV